MTTEISVMYGSEKVNVSKLSVFYLWWKCDIVDNHVKNLRRAIWHYNIYKTETAMTKKLNSLDVYVDI